MVRYVATFGDADAAFAKAEYTRKETFRCHRLTGLPLETRGQIAEWNAGPSHALPDRDSMPSVFSPGASDEFRDYSFAGSVRR